MNNLTYDIFNQFERGIEYKNTMGSAKAAMDDAVRTEMEKL